MTNLEGGERAIFGRCLAQLVEVLPDLDPCSVLPTHSLTGQLMLDSFLLSTFVERLGREFPDIDLGPWFMTATGAGGDTMGSLVAFLLDAMERQDT